MGILKIVLKNGNSQFFMSKIVKNWEFPFFILKRLNILGIPMSSLPLKPKKCLIFLDFPMKNVFFFFFLIPMSSLGGVHLISGIAKFIFHGFMFLLQHRTSGIGGHKICVIIIEQKSIGKVF